MNAKKVIEILSSHNFWIKGESDKATDLKEVTNALQFAINAIKQLPTDPIEEENQFVREHFDLEDLIKYEVNIDKLLQADQLNTLCALTHGIINYKKNNK